MMSYQLWSTLTRYNVSPNQLYFLDCCKNKTKPTEIIDDYTEYKKSLADGYIDENRNITPAAALILDEFYKFIAKAKKKIASEIIGPDFMVNVHKYRELFPKGRFPSGELARQNPEDLKQRFIWFFQTYPSYTWDLVLDATDYYLHLKKAVDYQYAVSSAYFIQKTDVLSKTKKSLLADYCQKLLDDPELTQN